MRWRQRRRVCGGMGKSRAAAGGADTRGLSGFGGCAGMRGGCLGERRRIVCGLTAPLRGWSTMAAADVAEKLRSSRRAVMGAALLPPTYIGVPYNYQCIVRAIDQRQSLAHAETCPRSGLDEAGSRRGLRPTKACSRRLDPRTS